MAQIARSTLRLSGFHGALGCRCLGTQSLPPLPYDLSALEPYISGEIMELHYKKHHQTYITAFNAALEQQADLEQKGDVAGLIKLQPVLRFNGGGASLMLPSPCRDTCYCVGGHHADAQHASAGHVNHSLFWENLIPPKVRPDVS